MTRQAIIATALHTPAPDCLEFWPRALFVIGEDGAIESIHQPDTPDYHATAAAFARTDTLLTLPPAVFLLPGLVDLHVHAPQWPQLGTALDIPLEDWLQQYTFPLEARYEDVDFARPNYQALVDTLLANGTTTALYFATIHLPATQLLADICLAAGQRALIGRVAMDNTAQCPSFYCDQSAYQAVSETAAFITYVRDLPGNASGLVKPVITPRFIPSCTDDLLARLGALARSTGCHVQTHCSESDWEQAYVLDRCGVTDTAALAQFGLLNRRTILAHGVFVSDDDLALIKSAGAGLAHCPLSNVYFSDAVFPLRKVLDQHVHAGLGTDIAGGASASLLENARYAVLSSRMLENGVDAGQDRQARRHPGARISTTEAFWLATAGGGQALDLPIGQFRPAYQFDAIAIEAGQGLGITPDDSAQDILQRIIYRASCANIGRVWVAGRMVRGRRPSMDHNVEDC